LVLAIPVCLYGLYQDFAGADHIASLGRGYVERGVAILFGGGTSGYIFRTLSTFTYSSSFSIFILCMAPFAWFAFRSRVLLRWRWLGLASLVLLLAAQISSGGRQALVFTVLTVILSGAFTERGFARKVAAPVAAAAGILLGFFFLGESKLARYETVLDMEQVRWRYETYFVRHNLEAIEQSPLGHGSGVASTAARHVGGVRFRATETAISRLAWEVGLPGILAYLWALVSLLRRVRQVTRETLDRELLLMSHAFFALGLVVFATSFNGWPLDVPPLNGFFWMLAGMVLLAPRLDRRADSNVSG